ncbi:uncharacterized protein LOC122006731 [Zingiber officinale]|uniref:uncharacterized protein LOC122006731 n=1 Tax=Zingiber officinale TaxID=94328 RepID=UPI001C4AAA8C|nr:uncharacterized protein LOC122006731 [Zingiber officinale]
MAKRRRRLATLLPLQRGEQDVHKRRRDFSASSLSLCRASPPSTNPLLSRRSSSQAEPPSSPRREAEPPPSLAEARRETERPPLLVAKQSRLPLSSKLVAKQSRPPLLLATQRHLPLSPKLVAKQSRPPLLVAFLSRRETPRRVLSQLIFLDTRPYDLWYLEILHLFGDSSSCAFSIHNLLEAGKAYGLVAGSWLAPYAMCRTWEMIINTSKEEYDHEKRKQRFPMVLYIVSGDKDGEQGGAPVVCIEVAARLCHDFNKGQQDWAPILLLVPLVLGLEKINPRYIPLLWETFAFPQCLGILGGKPGASTYTVGVQDEKALYLDPHEVQSAVDIKMDDQEADCSSYHCRYFVSSTCIFEHVPFPSQVAHLRHKSCDRSIIGHWVLLQRQGLVDAVVIRHSFNKNLDSFLFAEFQHYAYDFEDSVRIPSSLQTSQVEHLCIVFHPASNELGFTDPSNLFSSVLIVFPSIFTFSFILCKLLTDILVHRTE